MPSEHDMCLHFIHERRFSCNMFMKSFIMSCSLSEIFRQQPPSGEPLNATPCHRQGHCCYNCTFDFGRTPTIFIFVHFLLWLWLRISDCQFPLATLAFLIVMAQQLLPLIQTPGGSQVTIPIDFQVGPETTPGTVESLLPYLGLHECQCELNELMTPMRTSLQRHLMPSIEAFPAHWIPFDQELSHAYRYHLVFPERVIFYMHVRMWPCTTTISSWAMLISEHTWNCTSLTTRSYWSFARTSIPGLAVNNKKFAIYRGLLTLFTIH